MRNVTIKGLLANLNRFALTTLAVVISVAFLTATLLLTSAMGQKAGADIAAANSAVDAVVRGPVIAENDEGPGGVVAVRSGVDEAVLDAALGVDGVENAVGVHSGYAQLSVNGAPIGQEFPTGNVGIGWLGDTELNPYTLVEGSAPARASEIAIDRSTAVAESVDVGDHVSVLTDGGSFSATIVGLVGYGDVDGRPATTTTVVSTELASDLLGTDDFSEVRISIDDGAASSSVIAAVDSNTAGETATGQEYTAELRSIVDSSLAFLSTFLTIFAAVSVLAGITIIYNTFVIAIAERTRELALLRAVGATRRQLLWSVVGESVLIGVTASAIGLVVGVGAAGLLKIALDTVGFPFLDGAISLDPATLATGAAIGVAVTVASAVLPARKASAIAPVAALRDAAIDESAASRRRTGVGVLLLGAGVAAIGGSVVARSAPVFGVGMLTVLTGTVVAGPALARAMAATAGAAIHSMFGVVGRLAQTNTARHPRRSSSTALALTLGMTLVAFFTIIASSLSASLAGNVNQALTSTHVVTSASPDRGTIEADLVDKIQLVDGVEVATSLRQTLAAANGEAVSVAGIDTEEFEMVYDLDVTAGALRDIADGGVAVQADSELSTSIGDTITIEFPDSGAQQLTVDAFFSGSFGGFDSASYVVSDTTLDRLAGTGLDSQIYVTMTDSSRTTVSAVIDSSPGASLVESSAFAASASDEINSFRNFIYGLLAMAVVIALVGIANTTTLSIKQRTQELAVLRAIGMTPRQLRSSVRYEAALISILGAVLGLVFGVLSAWGLFAAVGDADVTVLSVPAAELGVLTAAAVGAGVLAAAWPAWRASRMEMLAAIQG